MYYVVTTLVMTKGEPTAVLQTATITVDSEWYFATYPDVAMAVSRGEFRSALHHYLKHGFLERRMPCQPDVDRDWYAKTYPDVVAAIHDGIVKDEREHYIKFGRKEGRSARADDPEAII